MRRTLMKAQVLLPGIYLFVALLTWSDFMTLPPDGLANLGLMAVVLPIVVVDLFFRPASRPDESIFVPNRWGYYTDQSIFFWLSALVIAIALCALGRLIDARLGRR